MPGQDRNLKRIEGTLIVTLLSPAKPHQALWVLFSNWNISSFIHLYATIIKIVKHYLAYGFIVPASAG